MHKMKRKAMASFAQTTVLSHLCIQSMLCPPLRAQVTRGTVQVCKCASGGGGGGSASSTLTNGVAMVLACV